MLEQGCVFELAPNVEFAGFTFNGKSRNDPGFEYTAARYGIEPPARE